MQVITYEGIVENGQIRFAPNVRLPEHVKVYVVVTGIAVDQVARIYSPRLVHREQAADFKMEIIEDTRDAQL